MNRLALLAALAAAAIAPVSAASAASSHVSSTPSPALTLHVVDQTGVPAAQLVAIEHAVAVQANGTFDQAWHTARVRFSTTGIPVYIESVAAMQQTCGAAAASCHAKTTGPNPTQYIVLSTMDGLSVDMSHEVLEMLADPLGTSFDNGRLLEVCDPVENNTYSVNHIQVSDYVTPAWYSNGAAGTTDYMKALR